MVKNNRYQKVSEQIQNEAIKAAKATQRPGQSREQTKLIAQGIEKGIEHFKKQQKAKSRELNKKLNKASQKLSFVNHDVVRSSQVMQKQSLLSWVLLVASWLGFMVYFISVNLYGY